MTVALFSSLQSSSLLFSAPQVLAVVNVDEQAGVASQYCSSNKRSKSVPAALTLRARKK